MGIAGIVANLAFATLWRGGCLDPKHQEHFEMPQLQLYSKMGLKRDH